MPMSDCSSPLRTRIDGRNEYIARCAIRPSSPRTAAPRGAGGRDEPVGRGGQALAAAAPAALAPHVRAGGGERVELADRSERVELHAVRRAVAVDGAVAGERDAAAG